MGIMYRVCDCEDWKYGMTQIDGFIMLGLAFKGYAYRGKQFVYCPWCGKQIKDADPEPPEEEVKTDSTGSGSNIPVYTTTTA